jgi:hypothetical protein
MMETSRDLEYNSSIVQLMWSESKQERWDRNWDRAAKENKAYMFIDVILSLEALSALPLRNLSSSNVVE